jgi:predicted nucleic acid-binding protein
LRSRGEQVAITSQNIIEFWAVATRPTAVNGFGWDAVQTELEVTQICNYFPVLLDTPDVYNHWSALVKKHRILGKRVHDARLVALMMAHSVTSLLTFNIDHFANFSEILALTPRVALEHNTSI